MADPSPADPFAPTRLELLADDAGLWPPDVLRDWPREEIERRRRERTRAVGRASAVFLTRSPV